MAGGKHYATGSEQDKGRGKGKGGGECTKSKVNKGRRGGYKPRVVFAVDRAMHFKCHHDLGGASSWNWLSSGKDGRGEYRLVYYACIVSCCGRCGP